MKTIALILATTLSTISYVTNATVLTYEFSGKVSAILNDDSSGVFASTFTVNDTVQGIYTINTDDIPNYPRPTFARYYGSSFDVMISGQHFYGSAEHRVFNDDTPNNDDVFSIINENGTYSSPTIGSLVSSTFFIQFFDYSMTALSDTSQVTNPNIADFGVQINGLRLDNPNDPDNDWGGLYFTLDSVRRVPEPSSIALFGLGIAGFWFKRRRLAFR